MTQVVDIVDIRITRESQAISLASLDVPMFMAAHTAFAERTRSYTSIEGVAEDFSSTSTVYEAASRFFGQQVRPPRIVIGRRQVPSVVVTPTVANNAAYSFLVQDETVSFTSDASATSTEIVDGLEAAFSTAGIVGAIFTDNGDGTFTIAPSTLGEGFSFKTVSTNLVSVPSPVTETYADSLAAIEESDGDFIAVTCEDHSNAAILALASAVEPREKVYGTSTDEAAVAGSGDTDIASQLKAAGYEKTFVIFNRNDEKYAECALLGRILPENPGSYTAMFKTLTGVIADKLTDTQTLNIKGKNCNTYESVGGINMLSDGVMANGTFIDEIIGVIALKARLRERVFFRLANTNKIGYTRPGFTILENDVRSVLGVFVGYGFLAQTPAPQVSTPDPLDISPEIRATRLLDSINFSARLASAVHRVIIRGTVDV